jgi:hypothetical protein
MKQELHSAKAEEQQSAFGLYFFLGVLGLGLLMIIWSVVTSGQ